MEEVRVARLHVVIHIAGEVELPDCVVLVKDAKLRMLVEWLRSPLDVKSGGIKKLGGHIKFNRLGGRPRPPQFTVPLGLSDV